MPSLTCTCCSYEIISGPTTFIASLSSPLQDGSPPKYLSIVKSQQGFSTTFKEELASTARNEFTL
jgi:hypothetical protein